MSLHQSGLPERRGYRALKEGDVAAYIASDLTSAAALGGKPEDWNVREVGDGNLNLVFIIEGSEGGLVVKQALPYVRLVGESWPLPLDRSYYEAEALAAEGRVVPHLIPKVHRYDHDLAAIVMEYLHPHIILRKGFIAGIHYPKLADDISTFMAETLFSTSDLAMSAAAKKAEIAKFAANTALCKITEDLVFTDPYHMAPMNRWTSPELDEVVKSLHADGALKIGAMELKEQFLSHAQCLVHGDLHSGSIMATPDNTRVIDPEFAFYGPMGFDIGAYIANVFLAFFSQKGHAEKPGARDAYASWLLEVAQQTWDGFDAKFRKLWREKRKGDAYVAALFEDQGHHEALRQAEDRYMDRLFADTLGFAGAKMIRRILGLAKVADLETIADRAIKAECEKRALRFARDLIVRRYEFGRLSTAIGIADDMNHSSIR
jgi:5-methylthioribose kinase